MLLVLWTAQGKVLFVNSDKDTIGRNSGVFWFIFEGRCVKLCEGRCVKLCEGRCVKLCEGRCVKLCEGRCVRGGV